jgi:hypothetical protein
MRHSFRRLPAFLTGMTLFSNPHVGERLMCRCGALTRGRQTPPIVFVKTVSVYANVTLKKCFKKEHHPAKTVSVDTEIWRDLEIEATWERWPDVTGNLLINLVISIMVAESNESIFMYWSSACWVKIDPNPVAKKNPNPFSQKKKILITLAGWLFVSKERKGIIAKGSREYESVRLVEWIVLGR